MWKKYIKKRTQKIIQNTKELLNNDKTVCISCGYAGNDIQGEYPDLYRGYGCPKCQSPFVMVKATGNELDE